MIQHAKIEKENFSGTASFLVFRWK